MNFAIFFFMSVLGHVYCFVDLAHDGGWARFYYSEYINYGVYFLFLALGIIYLAIDVLFRDFKTVYKYLIAISIAVGFFVYYYGPMLSDPLYLHHTADVKDQKDMRDAMKVFVAANNREPSADELAGITTIHVWREGREVGVLFPEETSRRVHELYPYLEGDNWKILVFKPLYMNVIHMSVVCVGFILLFFGYLYMKDPPQGAYIEKIVFLFLISSSLEILHSWSAINSLEFQSLSQVWEAGQYLSAVVFALIALAFATRLHFITSVKGEFYESELVERPSGVTRWRDSLDNIVIEKFFNRKLILGRMFIDPSHLSK